MIYTTIEGTVRNKMIYGLSIKIMRIDEFQLSLILLKRLHLLIKKLFAIIQSILISKDGLELSPSQLLSI